MKRPAGLWRNWRSASAEDRAYMRDLRDRGYVAPFCSRASLPNLVFGAADVPGFGYTEGRGWVRIVIRPHWWRRILIIPAMRDAARVREAVSDRIAAGVRLEVTWA